MPGGKHFGQRLADHLRTGTGEEFVHGAGGGDKTPIPAKDENRVLEFVQKALEIIFEIRNFGVRAA